MTTTLDYKQKNKHTNDDKMSQMMNFKQSIKCQQQTYSMKNRLFVLTENSQYEAIFKWSVFDGRKWQIMTTGSEIKPVISRVRRGSSDKVVMWWLNCYTLSKNTFSRTTSIPQLCRGFPGGRTWAKLNNHWLDHLMASFKLSSIRMQLAVNIGGRHGGSAICRPWRGLASSSRPSSNVCHSVFATDKNPLTLVSVKLHNNNFTLVHLTSGNSCEHLMQTFWGENQTLTVLCFKGRTSSMHAFESQFYRIIKWYVINIPCQYLTRVFLDIWYYQWAYLMAWWNYNR